MRLTLRTLLAWLDDTLPPEEVREIGAQVTETPYAQQLVDRIRKVTRQRRLTVPPNSGPEAVDPNLVAAYLDNELEADRVAEFEKRCLESDLHLAEVASCHQILSLIKNKAKVPPESRYRMYRLIKGSEAVRVNYKGPAPQPADRAQLGTGEMAAGNGHPPWTTPPTARPSVLERLGPPLVAVALITVLGVVGLLNLRYADIQVRPADELVADGAIGLPDEAPGVADPAARLGLAPGLIAEPEPEPGTITEPEPESITEPDPEGARPSDRPGGGFPDGVAAVVEQTNGLALGAIPRGAGWDWDPLQAGDSLVVGERIVGLYPFRSTLGFEAVRLTMIGRADLRIAEPRGGRSASFDLIDGDVAVRSDQPGTSIGVGFEGSVLALDLPPGQPVGLSWIGDRPPGAPAGRPILAILVPDGTLTASLPDGEPQAFKGPVAIRFDPAAVAFDAEAAVMPDWVANPGPSPAEEELGGAFADLFMHSPGSITFALLEGLEGDDPAVQGAAVSALGGMSAVDPATLEQVMPLLNRPNAPALRGSVIAVLRRRIDRGPEPAAEVRRLLRAFTDPPEAADAIDRLLPGLAPEDQEGYETYETLVADLSSPNPSVRQLALETLLQLSGRDAGGYDPDQPDGPGLRAWQELLRSGRLAPSPDASAPRPKSGDRRR